MAWPWVYRTRAPRLAIPHHGTCPLEWLLGHVSGTLTPCCRSQRDPRPLPAPRPHRRLPARRSGRGPAHPTPDPTGAVGPEPRRARRARERLARRGRRGPRPRPRLRPPGLRAGRPRRPRRAAGSLRPGPRRCGASRRGVLHARQRLQRRCGAGSRRPRPPGRAAPRLPRRRGLPRGGRPLPRRGPRRRAARPRQRPCRAGGADPLRRRRHPSRRARLGHPPLGRRVRGRAGGPPPRRRRAAPARPRAGCRAAGPRPARATEVARMQRRTLSRVIAPSVRELLVG